MKFLYIVVEGQSEEDFTYFILQPYFASLGFYNVIPVKIQTSKGFKGGFVNYRHLKNDVERLLKHSGAIVTTLVDFFRLPNNTPHYEECMRGNNALIRVECLEQNIAKDIGFSDRFVPYIQKFEFEALYFSNPNVFEHIFNSEIKAKIEEIRIQYPNPEDINQGVNSAPSKRLLSIIEGYNKVLSGRSIALDTGIEMMMNNCPRFNNWISILKEKLIE
jgi:hypothetical protein